jgi:hypothetical protein
MHHIHVHASCLCVGNLKANPIVLMNVTELLQNNTFPGAPDGIKVDIYGHVFATG